MLQRWRTSCIPDHVHQQASTLGGHMMQKLFLLLTLSALFVGCTDERKEEAEAFEKILEEHTGQDHSIKKVYTQTGNYVVYKNNVTGEFIAYNMDKFDEETHTTYQQFLDNTIEGDIVGNLSDFQVYIEQGYWEDIYETHYYTYEYWDEWCECYQTDTYSEEVWVGQYWVDTSYWATFYEGGGFIFDNKAGAAKDLELIEALKEDVAEKFVAHKLKNELALSTNRASKMARMLTKYRRLTKSRELTFAEKNQFALDAVGVNFNDIEKAIKGKAEGREDEYKKLLDKAAQTNKTSPEKIGEFLDDYID
jgi:hypothetical protein